LLELGHFLIENRVYDGAYFFVGVFTAVALLFNEIGEGGGFFLALGITLLGG